MSPAEGTWFFDTASKRTYGDVFFASPVREARQKFLKFWASKLPPENQNILKLDPVEVVNDLIKRNSLVVIEKVRNSFNVISNTAHPSMNDEQIDRLEQQFELNPSEAPEYKALWARGFGLTPVPSTLGKIVYHGQRFSLK